MPTPSKGPRLGGGPAHERLMLANLAAQLFEHKSIKTTVTKAKRLRPVAERLITFAKRGDLASRRRVLGQIHDSGIVHELFTEIAPAMAERPGGYTRITKIGPRNGDNAPMAVIELVLEPLSAKQSTVREAEAATKRSVKEQAAAEEPVAEETEEVAEDEAAVEETEEVAADDATETDEAAETEEAAEAETAEEAPEAEDKTTEDEAKA